jgi:hypothetical protein
MFIQKFEVRNFRCLKEFSLDGLKRINVFVGKNNTGKTSVLEALFLHAGENNPSLGFSLRGHRGMETQFTLPIVPIPDLWTDLFHNFDNTSVIELESRDARGQTRRSVVNLGTSGSPQLTIPGVDGLKNFAAPLSIEFTDPQGRTRNSQLVIGPRGMQVIDGDGQPPLDTAIMLPSNFRVSQDEDAARMDRIVREKRKSSIIELVRLIEPSLSDLALGLSAGRPTVVCDVGLRQLAPLPVLGEGTHKLVSIALAVSSIPNGILMIDEIENGIYYDLQKDFWLKLFGLIKRENVQLFVATHSRECLESLELAGAEQREIGEDVRLIRLSRKGKDVFVSEYDFPALRSALATGYEVR